MQIINGTQSTVCINEETGIVKKIATRRGQQDLVDQICFYQRLPVSISHMFPEILEMQNGPDEFYYTYKCISGRNLRELLLKDQLNAGWMCKLIGALNEISRSIHTIARQTAEKDAVYHTYLLRCRNRIQETKSMLEGNGFLIDADIIMDSRRYVSPVASILQILENNIDSLLPDYVCTTHGQLGPSHLFLNEDSDAFTLIDPKGFGAMYDPVIDICKIGKAMLFATEWLEENRFSIEYFVTKSEIYILEYVVDRFCAQQMQEKYQIIVSSLDFCKDPAVKKRIIAMICADLVGGLPFAFAAGGEKRVVALMAQIARASELLCTAFI